MAMSSTTTHSSRAPYVLNTSVSTAALLSERTVPRTENPLSNSALTTQVAMYPLAPVTSTFPESMAGILSSGDV